MRVLESCALHVQEGKGRCVVAVWLCVVCLDALLYHWHDLVKSTDAGLTLGCSQRCWCYV